MKGLKIRAAGETTVAAILSVMAAGCTGGEASQVEDELPAGRIVSVEVAEIQPESFTDYIQMVGRVEANREVTVSAEEAGTIRELLIEKGEIVAAGQPIARIDDRVLRPQVQQAAAEAELARETWERQRRLWEEDGIGSEIAYLEARYRAETTAAGARALEERLERTIVRAPIDGVLNERLVEIGTLVSPGTAIGRIMDAEPVKVAGGVPERFAGQVHRGSRVQVGIDGLPGTSFTGEVGFVGAAVDQANRSFPIEVVVPNEGGALKPGMVASVRVVREVEDSALVVPQEAVLRVEDGYIVYTVSGSPGDERAQARAVQLGATQSNRVAIQSGIQPGDRVIIVGQNRVAQGDRVQVVQRTAGR